MKRLFGLLMVGALLALAHLSFAAPSTGVTHGSRARAAPEKVLKPLLACHKPGAVIASVAVARPNGEGAVACSNCRPGQHNVRESGVIAVALNEPVSMARHEAVIGGYQITMGQEGMQVQIGGRGVTRLLPYT